MGQKNRHSITRKWLYKKYKGICQYCNKYVKYDGVTKDHIIPLSLGGTNRKDNLVLCCYDCNQKKGKLLSLDFFCVKYGWFTKQELIMIRVLGKRGFELKKFINQVFSAVESNKIVKYTESVDILVFDVQTDLGLIHVSLNKNNMEILNVRL